MSSNAHTASTSIFAVEADIRYPTDAGLAADGGRSARGSAAGRGRWGARCAGALRAGKEEGVLELTAQTGQLLARSVKEARRLAAEARRRARGRGAKAKLNALYYAWSFERQEFDAVRADKPVRNDLGEALERGYRGYFK